MQTEVNTTLTQLHMILLLFSILTSWSRAAKVISLFRVFAVFDVGYELRTAT